MTRHVYFSTLDSGCERFLAAPVWDESFGDPLSVMSAFARLGLEPWGEADRLLHLPPHGAASALAASLSRLPMIGADRPDYAAIASRLVALLPERRTVGVTQESDRDRSRWTWLWLAVGAALVTLLQSNGYLF